MSGSWDDLDRELHSVFATARALGHTVDRADIRAAVARWIGIPEPRRTPTDLLDAILDGPRCVCGKCDG